MLNYIIYFVITVITYIIYQKFARRKLPPGPIPWPFIGNLVEVAMVGKLPAPALYELSKKYGDIYSLVIGVVPTVVVCGNETIRSALKTEEFDNRVDEQWVLDRTYGKKLGIVFGEGEFWQNLRKIIIRILGEFGFGKKQSMELLIQDEFEEFVEFLKKKVAVNETLTIDNLFNAPLANIVWSLVTGSRFKPDDPNCKLLVDGINEFARAGQVGGCTLLGAFPFLVNYLPGPTGFNGLHIAALKCRSYIEDVVKRARESGTYKSNPSNFIEVFLQEIDLNKDTGNELYTDENLVCCINDLMAAGSETSGNTMAFSVRCMVQHLNVQAKIRAEIDMVVGRDRMVSTEDRSRLRYTDATCLEVLRFTNVTPIGPRRAAKTIHYGPYVIPKGTQVIIDYLSVHMDEGIWRDPLNFRPERFISPTGEIVNAEKLIAFGAGKRNCIGEVTARTSLFIGLCSLIQNFIFEVDPKTGVPKDADKPGLTVAPNPFDIRLKYRTR